MKCFHTIKSDLIPPHYYEWNLFHESLRNELWSGDSVLVTPFRISFTKGADTISYERYNDSIRRRVNDKGHEVVLQSIDSFSFSSIEEGMHMDLEFVGGEKVEGDFFYFTKEGSPEQ
ncbi:ComGF family competence protein [Rossellomorea aquimaris]|nr:ComGF family competence protein [Rossellomorea aquimaris]NMH68640.1 ComGF family competence protein [Bacillus sp. RO3]